VSEAAHYIGLISGTSRDGVDAVLVSFVNERPTVLATLCLAYPDSLAARLERMVRAGRRPSDEESRELDAAIANHFADTALQLIRGAGLDPGAVRAIGSHGQTVWHDPDGPVPESIQLGSPSRIAGRTGVLTVGDFRRADIEAGGQGAPLAPLLHRALFRPGEGKRVVLNLGGIANVSLVDDQGRVSGFDTGPANCLLDAWIQDQLGEPFDRDGAWSAGGRVDRQLLEVLLRDPWLARPPPKSTGIEYFNLAWLQQRLAGRRIAPRDVQATLAELTAVTVADAARPWRPADLLLCGGGAHNADLVKRLRRHLSGIRLCSTGDFGIDPDWVEAVLFAWLARERLHGRPQDTRAITGAHEPILLGTIAPPPAVE
jgi:anhydro-N-acetylmuramic acid kinase